jgi:hypothetical protein
MNVATLVREVERLESERPATVAVSRDPVEFALSVGFDPDGWQRDLLRSDRERALLNCSRQSGKSTVAAALAAHKALITPGSTTLILAPSERQAKETFTKTAGFYRTLGYPIPSESYRKMGMELLNGSRVEALPGTEKTIRGFSGVDLLIVDEASRVEDGLYYAVRPMLAVSGGRLILMSTPHGRRGVFFEAWEHGGPEWERYRIPASECPRIGEDFLEAERRSMPEYWFVQEYECEFRDTEDQVFSSLLIEAAADTGTVVPTGGFEW